MNWVEKKTSEYCRPAGWQLFHKGEEILLVADKTPYEHLTEEILDRMYDSYYSGYFGPGRIEYNKGRLMRAAVRGYDASAEYVLADPARIENEIEWRISDGNFASAVLNLVQ